MGKNKPPTTRISALLQKVEVHSKRLRTAVNEFEVELLRARQEADEYFNKMHSALSLEPFIE